VLAKGFHRHGYPVKIANRTLSKLEAFSKESGIPSAVPEDSLGEAQIVVLAVKGTAAESVVGALAERLSGKTVVDATNPIADEPPQDGVLRYFTQSTGSLMERLQAIAPGAMFVKAFNSVGNPFMVDPDFHGVRPSMFIAGDSTEAKELVAAILTEFGWDAVDTGKAASARPIEALCQLWCAIGFNGGGWNHAFHLLKR
jgi:hypothetical protein